MMGSRSKSGLSVAVVGLGFGAEWVPVYQGHPDVRRIAVGDTDAELLDRVADRYGVERRFASLEAVLASGDFDAVHLLTPIPLHVEQSVAVLDSGRHCACAIPMAVSLSGIERIAAAQKVSGKSYMLMETEIYSRTFLYVRRLYDSGAMGTLQHMRGYHYQNMEGWPDYWQGLPPMHYSGHGLGPLLALAGRPVEAVSALGSGSLPEELRKRYGNPFPVESALFRLAGSPVSCEMTCCLFQMAREFLVDRFSVYGDRMGFESPQVKGESPVLFRTEEGPLPEGRRGRNVSTERAEVPDLADLVAGEIAEYVRRSRITRGIPLAHEFVRSILEERTPAIDLGFAANLTAAGICAHESALQDGRLVDVPAF